MKNKVNIYSFSQGAKNHGVIMPDANKEATLNAVSYFPGISHCIFMF